MSGQQDRRPHQGSVLISARGLCGFLRVSKCICLILMTREYLNKDGSWEGSFSFIQAPKKFLQSVILGPGFVSTIDFCLHRCSIKYLIHALPVGGVYRVWKKRRTVSGVNDNLEKSILAHRICDTSFVLIENISLDVVTPPFSLLNFIKSVVLYFWMHHLIDSPVSILVRIVANSLVYISRWECSDLIFCLTGI